MGNTPDYAISGMEIALNGRKLRQHRPASNAADGNLEAGERHFAANQGNNRCLIEATLLNLVG